MDGVRRLFWVMLLCLVAGAIVLACGSGDDDDDDDGAGFTGDVGEECDFNCYDPWCKNGEYVDCASKFCIGEPDDLYCSVACDFDFECPENYRCTIDCNKSVAKVPLCVKNKDYQLLQELEYCPE